MAGPKQERLYKLLPAVYRIRDAREGEPLRALLAVIESELELVEADIDGLYRNWFIETCDEWVVPYIADLAGSRPLHTVGSAGVYSLRAYVANTIRYRRRKGTATVLEQLARDVSGWPARVVEFFQLLSTTQHMNHLRLDSPATADLRDFQQLDLLGSPFECSPYTGEVRRIASGRGKYNIPNIGLHLWRLKSYPCRRISARAVDGDAPRYHLNPLGYDIPLFNDPQTETEITTLAQEENVPGPHRRLALWEDLRDYRREIIKGNPEPHTPYFGVRPPITVYVDDGAGTHQPLPPQELEICNLSDWDDDQNWTPPTSKTYQVEGLTPPEGQFTSKVGVDPKLGRMVVLQGATVPDPIEVSYSYGFSSDLGGGPYDQWEALAKLIGEKVPTWWALVSKDPISLMDPNVNVKAYTILKDAVEAWKTHALVHKGFGVISILDSRTYDEELTGGQIVSIPDDSQLVMMAGAPPDIDIRAIVGENVDDPDAVVLEIETVVETMRDKFGALVRPHLSCNISVQKPNGAKAEGSELIISGLLIEGQLTVLVGQLGRLCLLNLTLVPGHGGLVVNESTDKNKQNSGLQVSLERTICGPISLPDTVGKLTITDCIVDASLDTDGDPAISALGADVTIESTTVFGSSKVRTLYANESIFTGQVVANRRQEGCVRFCHVPRDFRDPTKDSRVPRRYRCQPDLALKAVDGETADPEVIETILRRVGPRFTSEKYGDPAYAQLSLRCPKEISGGAEDGSEMGAFNHLKQPQREANLRVALSEYLRFGLEAGIFYVT